jgi:tRNA threonylcarbamoyl adenosine modification protein (Sua5/YciO/YrdC/YwlC family)
MNDSIMATLYSIHPEIPQARQIAQIAEALKKGAIMLYPTDTVYAIGCDLNAKSAVERVRQLKQLSNDKPLTFLCSSLSNISQYAWVSDRAYKIMKRLIPGPYTFLLPATKLVPKLVMAPKRKTTGIRVPDRRVCSSLLEALGNPAISTSAHIPDEEGDFPTLGLEKQRLFDTLEPLVDIIIDDGSEPGVEVSTILDLTEEEPKVVRRGLGWDAVRELDIEPSGSAR